MKKIILLIFLIHFLTSCKHKLNTKVEEAVNKICEESVVYPDWETKNDAYKNLFKVCTFEDLIYLTDNENSFVKFYAYIGLREKNIRKF